MATPPNAVRIWCFGVFEVDAQRLELRRSGTVVKLREQSFRILVYLLEHPGEIVTREELRRVLWPSDTFVDFEHSLNTAVMKLREALGDSTGAPLYIETIPKRGYRFIAPVSRSGEVAENGDGKAGKGSKISAHLLFAGIGMALLVILVTGFLARRAFRDRAVLHVAPSLASPKSPGTHFVPLTTVAGEVGDPAFSPDGQKIAFFWEEKEVTGYDLFVQLVGGEKPLRLTHSAAGEYLCCANWSPDGRQIAFSRCDDNGGGIFVVPALGGSERKLTDVACLLGYDGWPTWTLDGTSILLADRCVANGPRGIVQFSLATGEKRCLTSPPAGSDSGDIALALSPDGKSMAFIRSNTIGHDDIYAIELEGGHVRRLTHEDQSMGTPLMWAVDGQRVIFNSSRDGSSGTWRVPAAGGPIERETVYPRVGTLSRDGRRLAYVENSGLQSAIWRAKLASPGGKLLSLDRIIASSSRDDSPQLSTDGQKILFRSFRSGPGEIFTSEPSGDDQQQLTFTTTGWAGTPRWSPDRKWIVFDYRITNHSQIYMVDVEGRNLHAVTNGEYENEVPSWSRDGASVYFASNRTGSWQVWKHKLGNGEETQVTRNGGHAAFESYDAKMLYYAKFDGPGIWSIPVTGGAEQRVTDSLHRGYWGHFAITDEGIYLLDANAPPGPTVMYYSFQTKRQTPVFQITEHSLPWNPGLAASRDGRTVLFVQGVPQSTITMVDNLQ